MDKNSEIDIIKPKSSKEEYVYNELKNGVKVLLISDTKAPMSAAAMAVGVGSLSSTREYEGIPHFCEHMLFMGTEKYPDENEFDAFLQANSGSSNAYTSAGETVFHFDISNEAFKEAIDRFIHFFIDPLFKRDTVERELKAVDSEHMCNINTDTNRQYQLKLSESKENSAFKMFDTGNKETLDRPEIIDKLLEYFKKYYTPRNMAMCVVSNKSIQELKDLIFPLLEQIPKNDGAIIPSFKNDIPYDNTNLNFFYKIIPVEDVNEITIEWFLENHQKDYKEFPQEFIISIFGHEGPNTLTASLKRDNLISSLTAGGENYVDSFFSFYITVSLTEEGKNNFEGIILRIFKYIQILQEKKVMDENFCEEVVKIHQLDFDYQDKSEPATIVEELSSKLLIYEPKDVLAANEIIINYDKNKIDAFLNSLTLDKVNIYYSSKSFNDECDLTEKWYETKYTKRPMDMEKLKKDIQNYNNCKHVLDYPPKNKFIPNDLTLLDPLTEPKEYPEMIYQDEIVKIFYKKDDTFKLPKCIVQGYIYTDYTKSKYSNLYQIMLLEHLNSIITDDLNELSYMAEECNLNFNFKGSIKNFIFTIDGYNSSIISTLEEFTDKIRNINYEEKEEKLKVFNEKIKQDLNNFFYSEPCEILENYFNLIQLNSHLPHQKQEFLETEKIDLNIINDYIKQIFNNVRMEFIVEGNVSKEDAKKIGTIFKNKIGQKCEYLPKSKIYQKRIIKINDNKDYVYIYNHTQNPDEENNALISYFQVGEVNKKENIILKVITNIISQRFYDELRTKQAVGYNVSLYQQSLQRVHGIKCILQSNTFTPEEMWIKVHKFFNDCYKEIFEHLSDECFSTNINAVLTILSKNFVTMDDEISFYADCIFSHRYNFDCKAKLIKIIKDNEIKKEDVTNFYKAHFIDNIKEIDFEYVAEINKDKNDNDLKANNELCLNDKINFNFDRVIASSEEDIRIRNQFYPDFNLINLEE